jgi:hypothetical protein
MWNVGARMKKLVAGAVVALLGLGATSAAAQEAPTPTPTARFTAPTMAAGGTAIWMRSIDPCPIIPGAYMYVVGGFTPQIVPEGEPPGEVSDSSTADIRPDGSWELTVTVPSDFPEGVTKTFSLHAQCVVVTDPYKVEEEGDDAGGDTTTTTAGGGEEEADRKVGVLRYVLRPLRVTSAGSGAPSGDGGEDGASDGGSSSSDDSGSTPKSATPKSSASKSTSSWSRPKSHSTSSADAADASSYDVAGVENPVDPDDVRRELALKQSGSDDVALSATEVATAREQRAPVDGGIPWWAFAAATMLAVGAVVGWGARRSSAV